MRIIELGHPKKHWIYGVTITCTQCDTRYQVEDETDFGEPHMFGVISTVCPHCGHYNDTYKPRELDRSRR